MSRLLTAFFGCLLYLVCTFILAVLLPVLGCVLIHFSTKESVASLMNSRPFCLCSVCFGIAAAVYLAYSMKKK